MKISVLSENTSISPEFGHEHGLSLYIETSKHNILFDTGAGCLFKDNAVKMGIDIAGADIAVLSHGHYDHGGGLCGLLHYNKKARILVSPYAFGDYRAKRDDGEMKYIGLEIKFAFHERLEHVPEQLDIDKNLMIFSGVTGDYPRPSGNERLYVYMDSEYIHDDFKHEQNLVIREGKTTTLVAGCAHSGIVNILERCRELIGAYPDTVIGGFHLLKDHRTGESEDVEIVHALAARLLQTGAKFYTAHCTGITAYEQLQAVMGDRIEYLSTGMQITI